jgi:D-alanyl-D-alanine carboxypeptidase
MLHRTNIRRYAVVPALVLAAWAPAAAQTSLASSAPAAVRAPTPEAAGVVVDARLAAADSLLAAAYPANEPGAAVLVVKDGRVLLRKAYGTAVMEMGVPLRPEHVFRTGSITKQFTAVATLMLVNEGKISLDDEITKFFPDYPTHGRRITVEHLLTHTSGIRSYTGIPAWRPTMRTDVSVQQLVDVFRNEPMDFAPGEQWSYNNSGYVLLGAIIEKVSGQSYADFVAKRIFEPLGMRASQYGESGAVVAGRVPGYDRTREGAWQNAAYLSMTQPYAAGSILSTVDDLYRWQAAVAEGRMLSPELWRRAFAPFRLSDGRSAGYGYGWFVGEALGRPSVEHGGDINGFSSNGLWIPSERLHVIILANREREEVAEPDALSRRVAAAVLGAPERPAGIAVDAAALREYAGTYRVDDEVRRVVSVEDGKLVSRRGNGAPQEMVPVARDQFVYVSSGTRATFTRDASGKVTAMQLRPRTGPEELPSPRLEGADAATPAAVAVPAAVLDAYVGRYEVGPNMVFTIRRDGGVLKGRPGDQPEATLVARSETRFAVEGEDAMIEFERDASGAVTQLVLVQRGRRMPAKRLP